MSSPARVVITGVGLTAPNGNNLAEYRSALLTGRSGVQPWEIRYFGKTLAGICNFEATRYQKRKDIRRGTRAGSIAVYCANEALRDAGWNWAELTNLGSAFTSAQPSTATSRLRPRSLRFPSTTTTSTSGPTTTTRAPWPTTRRAKSP